MPQPRAPFLLDGGLIAFAPIARTFFHPTPFNLGLAFFGDGVFTFRMPAIPTSRTFCQPRALVPGDASPSSPTSCAFCHLRSALDFGLQDARGVSREVTMANFGPGGGAAGDSSWILIGENGLGSAPSACSYWCKIWSPQGGVGNGFRARGATVAVSGTGTSEILCRDSKEIGDGRPSIVGEGDLLPMAAKCWEHVTCRLTGDGTFRWPPMPNVSLWWGLLRSEPASRPLQTASACRISCSVRREPLATVGSLTMPGGSASSCAARDRIDRPPLWRRRTAAYAVMRARLPEGSSF